MVIRTEDFNYLTSEIKIMNGVQELISLSRITDKEVKKNTPKRVLKMYKELLVKPNKFPKLTLFDSNGYNQMIVSSGIKYYTFCEHHLLPFFGKCFIGYIPGKKRIMGMSKFSRVVEHFSKGINTQEYLTEKICNYIDQQLITSGIGVVMTGRHLCQEMRGIKKESILITSALRGIFLNELNVKEEFINLIRKEL